MSDPPPEYSLYPSLVVKEIEKKYPLGDEIARGVFGIVHESGKHVVKIMKDQQSFENERAFVVKISHPNSLKLEAEGSLRVDSEFFGWLVFPRVETSLRKYLEMCDESPDKYDKATRTALAKIMLRQLLPVLQQLDRQNICHNDLHTGNILMDLNPPTFYLHDYGIAMATEPNGYTNDVRYLVHLAAEMILHDTYISDPEEFNAAVPAWFKSVKGLVRQLPWSARPPFDRLIAMVSDEDEEKKQEGRHESMLEQAWLSLRKHQTKLEDMLGDQFHPVYLEDELRFDNCVANVLSPHRYVKCMLYIHENEPWLLWKRYDVVKEYRIGVQNLLGNFDLLKLFLEV
jgi:serine/threonine protein kinase